MDIGGVGRRPERTHEIGVLLWLAKASALAVHGVLDVQTDGTRGDQAVDERLRVLPVAGLDVDGDRDVDRRGDLPDAGSQFLERDPFVVGLADRVRHRVTADGERGEPGGDREIRRPSVPHRGQDDRVSRLVEFEQSRGLAGEFRHGPYNYADRRPHSTATAIRLSLVPDAGTNRNRIVLSK